MVHSFDRDQITAGLVATLEAGSPAAKSSLALALLQTSGQT